MNSSLFNHINNNRSTLGLFSVSNDNNHKHSKRNEREELFIGQVESLPSFGEFIHVTLGKALHVREETTLGLESYGNMHLEKQTLARNQIMLNGFCNMSKSGVNIQKVNQVDKTMDRLVETLYERIGALEWEVKNQDNFISQLADQNSKLREKKRNREEIEIKTKQPETCEEKRKERKLTMVDEFETCHLNSSIPIKNLEEFTVTWNQEKFVLIDVFGNKSDIVNYFYPLYRSKFPEHASKRVLEREEYKKLFETNPHVKERKRAWRISLYSIEFFHFVKEFIQSNKIKRSKI